MSPSLCILLLSRSIELLLSQLLSCPYPASWPGGTVISVFSGRGHRGLLMLLSTEPWASSCLMLIVTHGCVRWTRSSYLQSVSFEEPQYQLDKDWLSCLEKRLWRAIYVRKRDKLRWANKMCPFSLWNLEVFSRNLLSTKDPLNLTLNPSTS